MTSLQFHNFRRFWAVLKLTIRNKSSSINNEAVWCTFLFSALWLRKRIIKPSGSSVFASYEQLCTLFIVVTRNEYTIDHELQYKFEKIKVVDGPSDGTSRPYSMSLILHFSGFLPSNFQQLSSNHYHLFITHYHTDAHMYAGEFILYLHIH